LHVAVILCNNIGSFIISLLTLRHQVVLNVPLDILYVISETSFPANPLTGVKYGLPNQPFTATSKTYNYNDVTTQKNLNRNQRKLQTYAKLNLTKLTGVALHAIWSGNGSDLCYSYQGPHGAIKYRR